MIFPKPKGKTYEGYIITCKACETEFFATMEEIEKIKIDDELTRIFGPRCPGCDMECMDKDHIGDSIDTFVEGYYMDAGWVNKEMVDAWNKACIEKNEENEVD